MLPTEVELMSSALRKKHTSTFSLDDNYIHAIIILLKNEYLLIYTHLYIINYQRNEILPTKESSGR